MFRLALLLGLVATTVAVAGDRANQPPEGFTALFNGKDLTGWKATGDPKQWGAEDGVIFCKGGGGGYLMTDKEYGDFELRLEYKVPKMGNSGVALRSPFNGDPAYVGMEIQLLDDANWKGLAAWQHTGSIYNVVPASKVNGKAFGEWNTMRIVCKGRQVKVEQNGETLVDANLDEAKKGMSKQDVARHPGLDREKGHVGFQSYNFRVEFRNVFIKPL